MNWTPDTVIRLVVELGTLVAAIAALWKSITAHAKADQAQATADANTVHGQTLSDRVHELAKEATPPALPMQGMTALTGKAMFQEVAASVSNGKVYYAPNQSRTVGERLATPHPGRVRLPHAARQPRGFARGMGK